MKKLFSLSLAVLVMISAVACKSTPEPAPTTEEDAFIDAYEAVMPIIMDGAERYVVKDGDSLTKITRGRYGRGNAFFFPLIMAASKKENTVEIVDPDLIEPGMELVIPKLEPNLADLAIKARIKTLLESVATIYEERPDTRWSAEVEDGLKTAASSLEDAAPAE
jgi:hypothetical protein